MAKKLDLLWLLNQAKDEETKKWILKIDKWRDYTLKNNILMEDDTEFYLLLERYKLFFKVKSAFSTIEVYQEIFKEKNHFLAPGFAGETATTVFDIGANQGFYTLKLKERNPHCHVIAVEPNPFEHAVLEKNIQANRIDNVFLVQEALASSDKMTLEIIPQIGAISGKSVKIPERPWIKDNFIKRFEVDCITLDALFDRFKCLKADIVKIDIEGLEYQVLENASVLDRIDRMVIEFHNSEIRRSLIAFLKEKNFKLVLEEHSMDNYYGDLYFQKIAKNR